MVATVPGIHLGPDVHASRPSAASVEEGSLYSCTDHLKIYKVVSGAWVDYAVLGTAGAYAPGGTDVAVADGGTGASTASGARTNLGLVIGTDVEAAIGDIVDLPTSETDASLVLAPDGVGGVAFRAETGGGGGGSISVSEARLTSDVSVTANTYADGPSLSLAAGTYLLDGHVTMVAGGAPAWFTAKLMNGSTPIDSTEAVTSGAGEGIWLGVHGYIVLASTTTVKIQATASSGATIEATPAHNATGLTNTGSYLRAVKIA